MRRTLAAAAVGLALLAPQARAELPLGPQAFSERSSSQRLAPGVRLTRIVRSGGPWRVNVLTVERAALTGRLSAVLSNGTATRRERTSSMARRARALAGVNGGYFAVDGNPVGSLATRGGLASEPVGGRAALLLPRAATEPAQVAELRFAGNATLGPATRLLDGVDRRPGLIPACGGRGGDRPTQRPSSVLTCSDSSELVLLTPRYGALTPRGGVEAVVRGGAVTAFRSAGGTRIPRDGYVLWGSGDAARFLRDGARPGARAAVSTTLRAGARRVEPTALEAAVGGGPRLLRGGRMALGSVAEGFGAPSFFQSFVASRNPRTLAGVRADGKLLLVTVDGRRRGFSAGVTLAEAARVMRSLGARDALNLDGGGSTTMTAGRRVVNRPSDPGGERAVSDGLFVLP